MLDYLLFYYRYLFLVALMIMERVRKMIMRNITLNMKQQFHLVIRVMEFFILLPLKMAQKFLLIKSH